MTSWRVLVLDTKRSNPNHYICLSLVRALQADPRVERVVRADYGSALREAQAMACNLFIAFDGEELDRLVVERLARLAVRSVMWVTEDPYERSVNAANAELFDLIFTNDSNSTSAYGSKGRALALAADERFHLHAIPEHDDGHYLYDLFFAGTAWPNRSEFLRDLQAAIPNINLKLALPSNPYIPAPRLGMEPSAYDWRTPNTEFAKFANRSRSVLTLHRAFSSSGNDPIAYTPGPRFFEVALAGGFQLVDMSLLEVRVEEYYREGQEFIGFSGVGDCIEKLRHYLAHPEERLRIARAAQSRTRNMHLYTHRVRRLLDEVEELPGTHSSTAIVPGDAAASAGSARRRVLVVSHNILGVKPYGGVEVYQQEVRRALKGDVEFFFYTPDRSEAGGRRYTLRDESLAVVESFECATALDEYLLTCPEREEIFTRVLGRHGIEMVHFQHLIGHPLSLGYLPAAMGLRSMLSLHDFYAVCSRFNLLDYRGQYCDIPNLPRETCDVCLNAAHGMAGGSQARRHAFIGRMLKSVDVLHANTAGVAEIFARMYPQLDLPGKIEVCGVPMPEANEAELDGLDSAALRATERQPRRAGVLRIAIPGNFSPNKGGDQLIHAMNQLRDDPVEFEIVGTLAPHYAPILDVLKIPNLHVHGEYTAGTLPTLLAGNDLSIHFSIWPETYCISLTEAWAAGLVPIVADIGALGERVIHGHNGFKLRPTEAGSLVALIRRLVDEPEVLAQMKPNLPGSMGVTSVEHMQWLGSLYRRLLPQRPIAPRPRVARGMTLREAGILLVDPSWRIQPRAVVLAGGGQAPLVPIPPPGIMGRFLRYLRTHGMKNTARRLLGEVVRRWQRER